MQVQVEIGPWHRAPIEVSETQFAIGDSHGMYDLFSALLRSMANEAQGLGHLNFLGDFIDRGDHGAEILRLASQPAEALGFAGKSVMLGNHETFLLFALGEPTDPMVVLATNIWLRNGGYAFLTETGVFEQKYKNIQKALANHLRDFLGPQVITMLEGTLSHRIHGNLLFVHAGVDPNRPLNEFFAQERLSFDENHFAWIRKPFLMHEGPFEGNRIIVHGHTIEMGTLREKGRDPIHIHQLDGWRLGLDAGSSQTNRIAGAQFRRDSYRIFVARQAD